MRTWALRTVLAVVALTLVQMVAGGLLLRDQPPVPGAALWSLLSNLLICAVATGLAARLRGGRSPRIAALFVVLFGIPANYLAEAVFFDISIPRATLLRLYVFELLVSVALALVAGWRAGLAQGAPRPSGAGSAPVARLAGGAMAYVVAYFTAGLAAYPWLADFYAGRAMPTLGALALVQAGRGLGFSLVAFVLTRRLDATRGQIAWAAGLTLSIVGAIAPLIVPNAFLPTPVRLVHLMEAGVSNLLFGAFVGWLMAAPTGRRAEEELGLGSENARPLGVAD